MTWYTLPKKDAHGSDIRRVGATILWSGGVRMEKSGRVHTRSLHGEISDFYRGIAMEGGTRGTETSKYPKEEKLTKIPSVAESEIGKAQTLSVGQEW